MGNFLEQLMQRQAAHGAKQTQEAKPTSEMTEAELDAALIQAKQDVLNINREALQAGREAADEAKQRPRFLPNKRRRKTWR